MPHQHHRKISVSLIIFLLISTIFFSLVSFTPLVHAEIVHTSTLGITVDRNYALRNDVFFLNATTNTSSVDIYIFDPNGNLFQSFSQNANTSRQITVPSNAAYGTWAIQGNTTLGSVKIYIDVLDLTGWTPATFPYSRTWKNIQYTFFANGTINAYQNSTDSLLSIDLSTLRNLGLSAQAYYNDMGFRVRFSRANIVVDAGFAFLYNGLKFIMNGTLDQPRSFSFNIPPANLRAIIDGVKAGGVVFDYSDLKRVGQAFTYSNGILTLSLPQTFSFDPYIFSDGFESGDTTAWTGTSVGGGSSAVSVVTSPVFNGTYAAKLETDGTNYAEVYKSISATNATVRAYFMVNATPSSGESYSLPITMGTSASVNSPIQLAALMRNASGLYWSLFYLVDSGWQTLDVNANIQVNTWNIFEIQYYMNSATGFASWTYNGILLSNKTGLATDAPGGYNSISYVMAYLSPRGTFSPLTIWVDDFDYDSNTIGGTIPAPEVYVGNNVSNVDSSANIGSQSNFAAQQSGPNNINDTLTEANTAGSTTSTVFTDGFETDLTKWDGNGATTWDRTTAQKHTGSYSVKSNQTQDGSLTSDDINVATATQLGLSFWFYDHLLDDADGFLNYYNGSAYVQIVDLNSITGATEDQWVYYSVNITSSQYFKSNFRLQFTETPETNEVAYLDDVTLNATVPNTANYRLDIEEQWINLNYSRANEELSIFAGPRSNTENLTVEAWNGTWNFVMNLTANQWNNASISTWLTSSTFTIRFIDGLRSGDTNQDNWQIDAVLIHTWETVGPNLNPYLYGYAVITFTQGKSGSTTTFNRSAQTEITLLKQIGPAYAPTKQGAAEVALSESRSSIISFSRYTALTFAFLGSVTSTKAFDIFGAGQISFNAVATFSTLLVQALSIFGSAIFNFLTGSTKAIDKPIQGTSQLDLSTSGLGTKTFTRNVAATISFLADAFSTKAFNKPASALLTTLGGKTSTFVFSRFGAAELVLNDAASYLSSVLQNLFLYGSSILNMLTGQTHTATKQLSSVAQLNLAADATSLGLARIILLYGTSALALLVGQTHTVTNTIYGIAQLTLVATAKATTNIIQNILNLFSTATLNLSEGIAKTFTFTIQSSTPLDLNGVAQAISSSIKIFTVYGSALLELLFGWSATNNGPFPPINLISMDDAIAYAVVAVLIACTTMGSLLLVRRKRND